MVKGLICDCYFHILLLTCPKTSGWSINSLKQCYIVRKPPVADPGFPVGGGGCQPILGGCQLRRVHFLVKMYAKMKEIDPVGGGGGAGGAPPWIRQ